MTLTELRYITLSLSVAYSKAHENNACPNLQQNHNLQKTIEGTSLETLRHMVASGLGITVLPSSAT